MSEFDFEHVNLKDIDPNLSPLDEDTYNLRVTKAEMVTYEKEGTERKRVSLGLTVFDHPKYAGRRLFETLFPGEFATKALRRVMDATGVAQDTGEPLESWLDKLVTERAEFRVLVQKEPDVDFKTKLPNPNTVKPDGSPGDKNRVNWFKVAPVA